MQYTEMQSKTLNTFLSNRYSDIMLMSQRICKFSDEYEDVGHYVISKFIEHKRADELIEKGEAMKFLSGMIHLSFHSSTSPYHTLYRQKGRMHELYDKTIDKRTSSTDFYEEEYRHSNKAYLSDVKNPWYDYEDEYDYEKDTLTEAIRGILEEMQAEGVEQWYRSMLFAMWVDNPNYSELERQTKIPRTSISQAVQECKEYIKQELKNRNIDYDI